MLYEKNRRKNLTNFEGNQNRDLDESEDLFVDLPTTFNDPNIQ